MLDPKLKKVISHLVTAYAEYVDAMKILDKEAVYKAQCFMEQARQCVETALSMTVIELPEPPKLAVSFNEETKLYSVDLGKGVVRTTPRHCTHVVLVAVLNYETSEITWNFISACSSHDSAFADSASFCMSVGICSAVLESTIVEVNK